MNPHNTEHTVAPQQQPSMMIRTKRWMIVPLSVVVLLFSRVNAFVITTISTSTGYIPTHRMIQSQSTLNGGRRNPDNVLLLSSTTTKLNEEEEDTKIIQNNSIPSSSLLPDYGTTPIEIDQIKIIKKKWRRPELLGQSLIEQTMNEITNQKSNEKNSATLINVPLTKEERIAQRRSLQQAKSVPNFEQHVHAMAAATASTTTTTTTSSPLQLLNRKSIPTILQINIGLYCNQACQHCHGTLYGACFLRLSYFQNEGSTATFS